MRALERAVLVSGFLLCPLFVIAQNQDSYFDSAAVAEVREQTAQGHGATLNYLAIGERLEQQVHDGDKALVWEAQGWLGYDLNRVWLKTEGHYNSEDNDTEDLELQMLWSHAVSPFWDLQLGLRHDFEPDSSRDYAVAGLMGLAPYWFEVDAAAFVSDEGDVSTRLEAEYELRFTQRLILQPRLELNYAFSDDPKSGIGQGFSKVHAGLRLRYEFRREFAPYLGIAWEKSYGQTARLLQAAGKDNGDVSFVAGLRIWY
jgi:copper resistance protein B